MIKSLILDKKNVLAIWMFRKDLPLKSITKQEKDFTRKMSDKVAYQFIHSRGYARYALSQIFNEPALEIPLDAKPSNPPKLPSRYGYVSLSHCTDMLAVAWSMKRLGIDIERSDRKIEFLKNFQKLFPNELKSNNLYSQSNEILRSKILNLWVLKESLVKWEQSKIIDGLKDWKLSRNYNYGTNKKLGLEVKVQSINFKQWKIGLASNHIRNFNQLQVCN